MPPGMVQRPGVFIGTAVGPAARLARVADAVAALHLEDAVVIRIEVVAVLGAVVDIGEGRKRMDDAAGRETRRPRRRRAARRCVRQSLRA